MKKNLTMVQSMLILANIGNDGGEAFCFPLFQINYKKLHEISNEKL
jgi:hypothetical protein